MLTSLYSWVLQRRYTASSISTASTTPASRTSSSQMAITSSVNSDSGSIASVSTSASPDSVPTGSQNDHQILEHSQNSFNLSSESIIHDDSAYNLNNCSELKFNISSEPHQHSDAPINSVDNSHNIFESALCLSNSSFVTINNTLISNFNNSNMQQQPISVQVQCSPVFVTLISAILTTFQKIMLSLQSLEPHINSFADNPICFVISGYKTAYSNKNVRIIFAAIMYLVCFHSSVRLFCFVNAKVNDYFMYSSFDDLKYHTGSIGNNRNITEPYTISGRDSIQETRSFLNNGRKSPGSFEFDREADKDISALSQYIQGGDTDKTSESESGYASESESERENILGSSQLFSGGDSNKNFISHKKKVPYIADHPSQNISANEYKSDRVFEVDRKVNSSDFGSQSLIKCESSTDGEVTESTFSKYALRPYMPALIQSGEDESNSLNMNQPSNNLDPISALDGSDTESNDTSSFSLPQSESTHLAGGFNDINLSIDSNSRSLNLRPSEIVFNCSKDTCQSNYPSPHNVNNTRAQIDNVKIKRNSLKEKLGPATSEIKKISMATPEDSVDRLLESPLETGGAILSDYALSHLMKIQPKMEKQAFESSNMEQLSPLKHPGNIKATKKSPFSEDLFNMSNLPAASTTETTASFENTNNSPESNFKTSSLIINISPTKSIPRLENSSRPPSRLSSRFANLASSSESLQQTPKTSQKNVVGANPDLEDIQNRSSSRTSSSDSKTFNSVASITSKTLNAKPSRFSSPRKNSSVSSAVKQMYYDLPQQVENLFNVSSYTNEQYLKEVYNVDYEDHTLAHLAQGNEKWVTKAVSVVEIDSLFFEFSGKETAENWKKRSENADAVVVFLQREDLGADIRQAIKKNFLKHLDDLLDMVKTKRSTLTKKAIYLLRDLLVYGDVEDVLDIVLPKSVLALLNLSFASSARSRFLKDLSLRTACDIIVAVDLQQFLKLQGAIFKPAAEKININSKVFYHWSLEVYKAYILCHRTELTENYAATISEEAQKHSLETTSSRMCNDFTELMLSAQKNTLLHKIITKSLPFFSSLNKVISGHVQSRKAMVEIFLIVQKMAPILEPLNVIYSDVFDKATQAKIKRENLDPSLFLSPYLTLPSGDSAGDLGESSSVQLDPSDCCPSLIVAESSKARPIEANFSGIESSVEKPQDSKLIENDDSKNTTLFRPLGSSGNKSNNSLASSRKSYEAGKENEEPAVENPILS